ncbi:helix-turn-helix domain-containing protein [Enterococcus casseliflavus]|nr:helix-turn-helix domain-containing protein [Enterococcus casseliflavus]
MRRIHPFLENDIRYQIQLLDYLYNKESQWVSIDELANEIGLQVRAVTKYILSIKEVIELNYYGKLFLEMQGNQFFKLGISYNKYFFELRGEVIEKSLNILILKKLFFFNELNIVKFSLESFVSLSTIKRKIKRLNSVVQSFNFKISSRDNIYRLVGTETNIRFFFSFLFMNIYSGGKWPFFNIDQTKIFKLVEDISADLSLPVTYSLKNKIAYNHAIGITRYFHNETIVLERKEEWNKIIKINNKLAESLSINVITLLKENYLLSESEAQHEFSRIQIGQSFYQDQTVSIKAIELHSQYETSIYKASQHFLELFEKYAEIKLSDSLKRQVMITTLCGHYKAFLYREMPLMKQDTDGILNHYHSLKSFVEKIYNELLDKEDSFLATQKNFLINQYMYVLSEILPLNYFESVISIYFDDPIDRTRENLVKKMLVNFFQEPFNLRVYGPSDVLFFDKTNIDLVLSAIYTEEIIDNYPNTPIIFVKFGILNLSEDEILLLKEALSIISENKQDKFKLKEEFKKNRKIFIN